MVLALLLRDRHPKEAGPPVPVEAGVVAVGVPHQRRAIFLLR